MDIQRPKQGTPSWISGGFLGKGYTLQESLERSKSPSAWSCTKRKLYPQPTPPRTRGTWRGHRAGPLALPSAFPTLCLLRASQTCLGPQGSPLPPPGPSTGVCAGGPLPAATSLPGAQRSDLGSGRQGEQIQEDQPPAGQEGPHRGPLQVHLGRKKNRKCGKEPWGPRERAGLAAGLGASLSFSRSGPCAGPLSTRRWDSVAPDFPGP